MAKKIMTHKSIFGLYLVLLVVLLSPSKTTAAGYYIDCSAADNGDGRINTPWNTIISVNNHAPFLPGDTIFLKKGSTCFGELWPKGNGNSTASIVISAYGSNAALPVIDAQGKDKSAALKLFNQKYWTIQNLTLKNSATTYGYRWGIFVDADDSTIIGGIHILNNIVQDVYASAIRTPPPGASYSGFYDVAGIYVRVREPGRCADLLIEGNIVRRIVGVGISYWGENEWTNGGMNWSNLSTGVVVRGNTVDSTAGDGIIIVGTDNELVEYNTVEHVTALGVSGTAYTAGMWPTRHRNGLWQFNTVAYTKLTGDGQAFDNDVELQGTTVFQYNLSHHNEGGFFLDCCGDDGGKSVLRYNISLYEPGFKLMRSTALIHNNTFYYPSGTLNFQEAGSRNRLVNNIFWAKGFSGNINQMFSHNLYHGGIQSPAADTAALSADPRFVNPGGDTAPGYRIQSTSPCIRSGILIPDNGGKDYWGRTVAPSDIPNRGADGYFYPTSYKQIPTTVELSGPVALKIPVTGTLTSTFTAFTRDQFGLLMQSRSYVWRIETPIAGITVDSLTGVISVASKVAIGNFTLQALDSGAIGSKQVLATFLYDYAKDFNGTQGLMQWHYSYRKGTTLYNMSWDAVNANWKGDETYLLLGKGWFHPGNNADAVLYWIAPISGRVHITGNAKKGSSACGGNGVVVSISHANTIVWGPETIAYDDVNTGKSHDINLEVKASDTVYFVVNANGPNGCDATEWNPIVYYQPGTSSTATKSVQTSAVGGFTVYPNTGKQSATLRFYLTETSPVTINVFNVSGKQVATPLNGFCQAGYRTLLWNGLDNAGQRLPTGMYWVRLTLSGQTETRQLMLVK